jgi:hypothetical protein
MRHNAVYFDGGITACGRGYLPRGRHGRSKVGVILKGDIREKYNNDFQGRFKGKGRQGLRRMPDLLSVRV